MNSAILLAAFSLGLFGSPHCLGMCGGIVTAFGLSMQGMTPARKSVLVASYHVGRLISYALLGVVASGVGVALFAPLMHQSAPRVLLGAVLVIIGLTLLGVPLLARLERVGARLWQAMAPVRRRVLPMDSVPKALFAGLLWGLLPCGMVYGALMLAVANHDTATGAALMVAFGLGTLPMLVATQATVGLLQRTIRQWHLRQINGALLTVAGVAVMVVPMWMATMHQGGHGHDHTMMHDTSTMHEHHMATMPDEPMTLPMNTPMTTDQQTGGQTEHAAHSHHMHH